jgi:hypothetical protein
MMRVHLLSSAAIGMMLAAAPAALAQPSDAALREMRGERTPAATPSLAQQERAAEAADALGRQQVSAWLVQADAAVRRGRMGEANELLERAETRLLTRSTLASQADRPMSDPVVDRIVAARRALMERDRTTAMREIAAARDAIGPLAARDDIWMGVDQDGGISGMLMSRADRRVVLAQAGGGGGSSEGSGSGGLAGSTPGSPGVGQQGSTPATLPTTPLQPGQSAAVPGAATTGRTAPPAPGTGGVGVGTAPDGTTQPQGSPGSSRR